MSLLWHRFDTWPKTFCVPRAKPKRKNQKKKKKKKDVAAIGLKVEILVH